MKLSQEELAFIQNIVNTAEALEIDAVIIEPDLVRGVDEDITTWIISSSNIPQLSFGSIGINRLDIFTKRFGAIKNLSDFGVEVVMQPSNPDNKTQFARALVFKGTGVKIDYRCANPQLMKAPRKINEPFKYKIEMSADAVALIQKGKVAMDSDTLTLIGTDEGVLCTISDINCDDFSFKLADNAEIIGDGDSVNFSHKYPIKRLLSLFKNNTGVDFYLTERGIMKTTLNNLDVYAMCEAE